jgi:hypothetical protein
MIEALSRSSQQVIQQQKLKMCGKEFKDEIKNSIIQHQSMHLSSESDLNFQY